MPTTGFEVLHQDAAILVVNKPCGLATQAPPQFDSLEMRLRQSLSAASAGGKPYLGVPHRLDRPASGVIVFALTRRAARLISRQFARRQVRKKYWALVEGCVDPPQGNWADHVWKVYGQPRAEVVDPAHPGAQEALLRYRTLALVAGASWLEIELETGRTHQVRLQAGSRGHPVLGDTLYGSSRVFGDRMADSRLWPIALHARSLELAHPLDGTGLSFVAPAPPAWPAECREATDTTGRP
jgi:RluA family pseudouridine synthase